MVAAYTYNQFVMVLRSKVSLIILPPSNQPTQEQSPFDVLHSNYVGTWTKLMAKLFEQIPSKCKAYYMPCEFIHQYAYLIHITIFPQHSQRVYLGDTKYNPLDIIKRQKGHCVFCTYVSVFLLIKTIPSFSVYNILWVGH